MKQRWSTGTRAFWLMTLHFSLFSAFVACKGQEDEAVGLCRLSCGGSVLAGSGFAITARNPPADFACSLASGPASLMKASWVVTGPDGQGGMIEKSAIGFNASLGGVIPYTDGDPSENSSDWHEGIKTPQSEWCSDSCGIARLTFQAECLDVDQAGSITIESGAVSSVVEFAIGAPAESK